jgi:hypothetical protein
MVLYDIHDLLARCFTDGFAVESISKATDIPVELINRCYTNGELTQEDIHTLNYLLFFLMQLYGFDPDNDIYLKDIVETMNSYFKIPPDTIAKYLGLDESELSAFLTQPKSYNDGYRISIKLVHLFTTLIRDKRHSM